MKNKLFFLILSLAAALGMIISVNAEEAPAGSWKLQTVIETGKSGEPIIHTREDSQSFFGSPESTYIFNEDGSAADVMFEAGEKFTTPAAWERSDDGSILWKSEDSFELVFTYDDETDTLHRYMDYSASEDAPYGKLDFVYVRAEAITGKWKLDTVIETKGDGTTVIHTREDSQSLYGTPESLYTFNTDGSADDTMEEDGMMISTPGSWEKTGEDEYLYTDENGFKMKLVFNSADDTLHRILDAETIPDSGYGDLDFVYARWE